MSAIGQRINDLASTTQENFKQGFSQFSNTRYVSGTREFLNSNSLVAKFAFIILVVIVFILCLRFTFQFLNWLFAPAQNPRLIKGLLDAQYDGPRRFRSNPNLPGAVPILRSKNENQGVEFTWSIWIHIRDLTYLANKKKHIFHKGGPIIKSAGATTASALTQAPGVWIAQNTNDITVRLDVYTMDEVSDNGDISEDTPTAGASTYEDITISGVPLNKWINLMIRVQGKIVDVFINGAIAKRHILQQVVRQNYGDTHALENGGFAGQISDLTYFSHALNVSEVLDIVNRGPDLTNIGNTGEGSFPPYFALRWYFLGNKTK